MILRRLSLVNYRNYASAEVGFSPRINVLVGANGSGKTNLLDAVYYLSFTRSSRQPLDSLNVRHGADHFSIRGDFNVADRQDSVAVVVQAGARKSVRVNGSEYGRLSDHIGRYPVVLADPDDVDLIREGGEIRRRFFDILISQVDHVYLENLMRYNSLLKQRNGLLRLAGGKPDRVALESYDALMGPPATYIYERRKSFLGRFIPVFDRYFKFLVEEHETASVAYLSGLDEMTFEEGLQRSRERDIILQRTTFGIHRDDFRFLLGTSEMKKFGSQGQRKTMVIAMRLAHWDLVSADKGFRPILLLDDIFDKLDDHRIGRLLDLMRDAFGQLFVTDARPDRTAGLLRNVNADVSVYTVDRGTIILQE
ncbi:MAG TPA: DNA replication/repair protein RecF [Cyclobacteriaceae bacterium]|nr:DNA replication/repair protein RecF [Cyclobacteriaceae bacterium]